MRKLYEEGLIHTDSFVMDRARVTALGENETPILGAATGRWTTQFTAAGTSERMNEFVAIPPLKCLSALLTSRTFLALRYNCLFIFSSLSTMSLCTVDFEN